MFSNLHLTRGLAIAAIVAFVAGAGHVPAAHAQSDVTLRVVGKTFVFEEDTTLEVDLEVSGAVALAGLDLVLSYPEELLPAEAEGTGDGEVFGLQALNYDFASVERGLVPPAGRRYLSFAGANSSNASATDGRVVTVSFPVTCLGNAQRYPDGREVSLEFVEASASTLVADQDGDGFDDLASVSVTLEDGTIILNCTTVSNEESSFGTLKSVFGLPAGVR